MLYNIIILEPFTSFYMICDLWQFVTVIYDVMLISNTKYKINGKENKNKKTNRNK